MDENMMMILQLAAAIGFFFILVWIFQMIYNAAVPAIMESIGNINIFRPINYQSSLAILLLLMIVGGMFSAKIIATK